MKGYKQAKTPKDYLLQRIKIDNKTGCWNWVRGKDKNGYGQCHDAKCARENKVTRAHQLAFVMKHGKIPKGKIICHNCDNPSCCNPDHLYAGTWKDNVHDCIRRGRYVAGSLKPKSYYEPILAVKGKLNCLEAAEKFNLSFSRVCQIWRGEFYHGK